MLTLIISDAVPVGGFCKLDEQCTVRNNSGICEHGRCICADGFTLIDLVCEKSIGNKILEYLFLEFNMLIFLFNVMCTRKLVNSHLQHSYEKS